MTSTPPPGSSEEQRWRDPHPYDDTKGGPDETAAQRALRATGTGAKATARGVHGVARVTGAAGGRALRLARRASHAEGAGESGLFRLIELHAVNAAADAAIAISLAGTLFFQVPTGEARGQVALFLALTMLPFAIVAPLIGPFLDRFSHGRRWAIGATMAVRAFLCWVLASAVATESTWMFPAALGCLVASKAYGVTKAAAVPRLVPRNLTLVKVNGRLSLAGVVGAAVSAPIAALAATIGAEWALRYAFLLFLAATALAILLPAKVDSSVGEAKASMLAGDSDPAANGEAPRGNRRPQVRIPGTVAFALRGNCGPRWLSGFLTMFMAFLLRENPIDGWRPELLLAIVIGAAGLGNTLGIALAALLRRLNPTITVVIALAADAALALFGALFYGVLVLAAIGFTAGLAQILAKLSLDSLIQRDVPERVRTSAFARSDTVLQLAWVVGGFVGIVMPLEPRLGLGIAFGVLAGWFVFVLAMRPRPEVAAVSQGTQ
ncbi:MFS transporter [Nocardioides speluncae]|uniref:MFS transporter n=1 Tax=Nocardioides speluncae TaxID=2670337 RepID=UPI000D68C9A9|nr:MFS transporter [Nocardioides speluncae]